MTVELAPDQVNRSAPELTFEYAHNHPGRRPEHWRLVPKVVDIVRSLRPSRVLDMGCGNGWASQLLSQAAPVVAIDSSTSGIAAAKDQFKGPRFEVASVYDDLAGRFGCFPVIVSLEVIEHLFDPRRFARVAFEALEPGGTAVVTTPYHGYWKNLALALTGRMDAHFTALWDAGHIKFWSIRTMSELLTEAGFVDLQYKRFGRIPPLASSMIVTARRPG